MEKTSAVLSSDGLYRYHLQRIWQGGLPRICWIMLNPSTADAEKDDPTIRRCIAFSKAWGAGGLDVVNLFALRATNPNELKKRPFRDAVGASNDSWICAIAESSGVSRVIAAWGRRGEYGGRDREVLSMLRCRIEQVGKADYPRHPLYLRGDLQPELVREA